MSGRVAGRVAYITVDTMKTVCTQLKVGQTQTDTKMSVMLCGSFCHVTSQLLKTSLLTTSWSRYAHRPVTWSADSIKQVRSHLL